MGFVKLELRVPDGSAHGKILAEPDPYWTLDSLITELNTFQIKNSLSPPSSSPSFSLLEYGNGIKQTERTNESIGRPFMMCISGDDDYVEDDDERDIGGNSDQRLMMGTRFSCPEADFNDSEESDCEFGAAQPQVQLMDKKSLAECYLFELERENQLRVMTELKKKAFALEVELRNETNRSLSALSQLEQYAEARREQDRQTDKQYQRRIAEALDRHLSIVQRDQAQRSQLEEQRIKDDAALEDAKKKEKVLEEQLRREMAEAEARKEAARIAEKEQQAAIEAAKAPTVEPQAKNGDNNEKTILGETIQKQPEPSMAIKQSSIETREVALVSTTTKPSVVCRAADSALRAATERLTKHDNGSGIYGKLVSQSDKEFDNYQRQIARRIRQLTGTVDSVLTRSSELTNIMKDPRCPYPVSLMIFAKKILNLCENPGGNFGGIAFAVGHVIVRVTAQVPDAMDFVLAELHKACIYTIPKYLQPSKVTSSVKEYHKLIGYREENGQIESTDTYLNRIESYMKLYGALTQTEIGGIPNPHGIKEGWAWLARFLNTLPANRSTAIALAAFLRMAGFALFQKYKAQFKKMLNVISNRFLPALKAQGGAGVHIAITELETYLVKKQYLKEPEGRRLEASLSSRHLMA